jgi:hypothetical protein
MAEELHDAPGAHIALMFTDNDYRLERTTRDTTPNVNAVSRKIRMRKGPAAASLPQEVIEQ